MVLLLLSSRRTGRANSAVSVSERLFIELACANKHQVDSLMVIIINSCFGAFVGGHQGTEPETVRR